MKNNNHTFWEDSWNEIGVTIRKSKRIKNEHKRDKNKNNRSWEDRS